MPIGEKNERTRLQSTGEGDKVIQVKQGRRCLILMLWEDILLEDKLTTKAKERKGLSLNCLYGCV